MSWVIARPKLYVIFFFFFCTPSDLITRIAVQRSVNVTQEWSEFTHRDAENSVSLEYNYRVVCKESLFGPNCNIRCSPRDGLEGHYNCSAEGEKICLEGWTGEFCKQGRPIIHTKSVQHIAICWIFLQLVIFVKRRWLRASGNCLDFSRPLHWIYSLISDALWSPSH